MVAPKNTDAPTFLCYKIKNKIQTNGRTRAKLNAPHHSYDGDIKNKNSIQLCLLMTVL